MKSVLPHDSLDDLIAAALHGDLTPAERSQFDARLQTDAAARAAYQEAQLMHDLLEKTHREAQPDPAFEQRTISGVRRKIQHDANRETAWESVVALWNGITFFIRRKRQPTPVLGAVLALLVIMFGLAGISLGPITSGIKKANAPLAMFYGTQEVQMRDTQDSQANIDASSSLALKKVQTDGRTPLKMSGLGTLVATADRTSGNEYSEPVITTTTLGGTILGRHFVPPASPKSSAKGGKEETAKQFFAGESAVPMTIAQNSPRSDSDAFHVFPDSTEAKNKALGMDKSSAAPATSVPPPAEDISRKLIRNAELELEVKSFQDATDQIAALTKTAGGYVDTSNSQKGGNGKLQGTIVVKVLPKNLDDFLLKLRDLGKVVNQSVKTDDVTKDYFDTQARLENSRKMEVQLQELLKRENGKVSDLLQVERELGRVRGEIEQMQGTLKVYDFDVAYATVTMQVREKDLNQAAAYLLKEQDNFSLFATDVEGAFQKARQVADDFKAQILQANLNHNSGSDVSADLVVMVAPDQIEPFLAQVRSLGRVADFTRETQRVAKDGGESNDPADETLTEKDKVQVHLSIRSDDESRKQVALTVVTPDVDAALDAAKAAALANAGAEILSSSLNKTPEGQSTAQLGVRVPGKSYQALLTSLRALGRTASFSLQREDNSGPGADGDDAPVIVSLSLTDDDTPLQTTTLQIRATDVDAQAQQIKKDALALGVQVKASSFGRQPDGTETARMTFRLPMAKYPAFVESLKHLGRVESLTVQRDDRPDQTRTDETAPAEISLYLHNQGDLVADDSGFWSTLRQTFGEGIAALLTSVRVIGVVLAFAAPWVVTLAILAWIGRRIYIWRKK